MSASFNVLEHVIQASHIREYARATATSQEDPLLLHIKQYVPRGYRDAQKGDLTIIAAHANGFPKELYEPLWEDLLQQLRKRGVRLRSIWIADTAWQGRSGVLNRDKLGNDPGWFDYARDITHMINTFRMPRPIMGVGHSFGGMAIANVALAHPRLFSSVVFIEPVIEKHDERLAAAYVTPGHLSANRRDEWPSREEAAAAFAKSKFYQSWDPRALENWVRYGLIDKPGSGGSGGKEVVLATTKHQEVFTFQRPSYHAFGEGGTKLLDRDLVPDMDFPAGQNASVVPIYRPEPLITFNRLQHLRPRTLFVFGGQSYMSMPWQREAKMEATGTGVGGSGGKDTGRVQSLIGEDWGHLIPMEAPGFCAEAVGQWADETMELWSNEESKYEEWTRKPMAEKSTLDPELLERIKPKPKPKPKM